MSNLTREGANVREVEITPYGVGLIAASVCANGSLERAIAHMNDFHPTGLPHGWALSDDVFTRRDARGNVVGRHDSNAIPCNRNPDTYTHYLLTVGDAVNHITDDGRLPVEMCSVCRHQDFAAGYCICLPGALLKRGDITQEEAYVMIGVEPPGPDGFSIPLGGRRQRALWLRLTNRSRLRSYRKRQGHDCAHRKVTQWYMYDAGARQTRWCRACGYTEIR